MKLLERIVLGTPYLFMKKIPYAWIFAVALWAWPPLISGILLAIIAMGLLMMTLQRKFWETRIIREQHQEGMVYRVRPHMPLRTRARNVVIVLVASGVLAFLLNGILSLNTLQWFLLAAGFAFLYRDAVIFGPSTVYLVTSQGIGVHYVPGHVDYRLFFGFDEIESIERIEDFRKLSDGFRVLGPAPEKNDGILLKAVGAEGFTRRLGHVVLTPPDPQEFMMHLPARLAESHALIRSAR